MLPQKIVRVRRNYNIWVANQTMEDFSLRFTAKKARKWSTLRVGNTALGAISFLALESIGASITLQYGFVNAMAAIFAVCVLIFATGLPISYYAAKHGVDIDLLSRGAGFGYIGSTVTSLIYASFTFIFFAIEAAILSTALEMFFGVPLVIGYLLSSLIVIPIVVHGFTFISRFQLWTQPIWLLLHLLPFLFIAVNHSDLIVEWTSFRGLSGEAGGEFNVLYFGAASAVIFSLAAQIGEQVDFLRFLPPKTRENRVGWWFALLTGGPGWIGIGGLKILAGSFLVFLAAKMLVPAHLAIDPSYMYRIAFQYVFSTPGLVIAATATFVIISQIKINVTNAYAGSIAWSNFFSRLTHSHPGRVVWLVFNVTIAYLLTTLGVYRALEQILGLYSIIAVAWVGALSADLVINKPLKLSPPHIEFRRAYLYDINPVGVGSILIAIVAALASYSGALGETMKPLASFLALGVAFCSAPLIAYATKGKYYLAREPMSNDTGAKELQCCICESQFEIEDMATCPVYDGAICSLCCSLDARCHDRCKKDARYSQQVLTLLKAVLPSGMFARVNTSVGHYVGLQLFFCAIIGAVLGLVYLQTTTETWLPNQIIQSTLWKVFFILAIISGVATWLFVLARESAQVAQEESSRQTFLLSKEIIAHQVTDVKLQKAKEAAEAANSAKSRYVVGLNHEFRTPLNSILGYSQLLERDATIPPHRIDAIRVIRRSSEHLTGLIEGLLDISKIEVDHFSLNSNEVHLIAFLEQLVDMFHLEADAKNIKFSACPAENLPLAIKTDEKRLRQVFINLLSNAFKFTSAGSVILRVEHSEKHLVFSIIDTGIGIHESDFERIFEPFERGSTTAGHTTDGTGLGLAITKLIIERMGGVISISSEVGTGSEFKVEIPVAIVASPAVAPQAKRPIVGYTGPRRTIMVTDDDVAHCGLVDAILRPLGFTLFSAERADECLELAKHCQPDLYLLDISMPGMNGLELAKQLRQTSSQIVPIMMISANAIEEKSLSHDQTHHSDYLMKPVEYDSFLEKIRKNLDLQWTYEGEVSAPVKSVNISYAEIDLPPPHHIDELRKLGQMGHIRGVQNKLDTLEEEFPECLTLVGELREHVSNFDLVRYMTVLDELEDYLEQPG